MNLNVGRTLSHFATAFALLFSGLCAFAGPSKTTYQAKIIKPDGYPLEASNVNFKFTILDPSATCVLYAESYSSVNMALTGGLISFSLGSGIKSYPASSTTFEQIFSNISPNMPCDTGGGPPAVFTPLASDTRKIIMQFNDGSGWQTLPAMTINAVPYAMYANDSLKLNGLGVSDFVQMSMMPSCGVSEAVRYNGASFSCVAVGGSGSVTSGSVITALGYTPADGASVTALTSSLSTTDSNVASVSSAVFSVSSTVAGLNSTVSSLSTTLNAVSGSVNAVSSSVAVVSTNLANLQTAVSAITSSQWVTSGTSIYYAAGSVGVGTQSPLGTVHFSGSLPFYFDRAAVNPAHIALRSAGGSPTSLTARASGEQLGQISFGGYDGTIFRSNDTGIIGVAAENWTGANNTGSELIFKTKSNGVAGNAVTRMKISEAGNVGIGTLTPTAKFHVAGGTSSTPLVKLTSGTLVNTPQAGSFEYDGSAFYLTDDLGNRRSIATASSSGTYDNATNISAPGNITLVPNSSVVVSSTTASTNSTTGALVVAGGLGVGGNINSSGTILTTSNIQGSSLTATSSLITPIIYGSTSISGQLRLESTTNSTKGSILIAPQGGNVGIGTTTPLAKLSVDGDGFSPNTPSADTVATFDNESNDVALGFFTTVVRKASVYFGITGTPKRGAISYQFSNTSADKLSFDVNSQTRMTVTGSGTVGIGVSSPTSMLHVVNDDAARDVLTLKGAPSQAGMWLRLNDSSDVQRGYISPNGGMPQLRLGVTNAITLTGEYGGVNEVPGGGLLSGNGNLALMNNTGTAGLKVMTGYFNGSSFYSAWEIANVGSGYGNLLLMKSGGNVGIGTTTPTQTAEIDAQWGVNNSAPATNGTTQKGILRLGANSGVNGEVLDFGFNVNSANGYGWIQPTNRSNLAVNYNLALNPNGGNVGIGTASPTAKLDVNGSINVSGVTGLGSAIYSWAKAVAISNAQAVGGQKVLLTLPAGPQNTQVEISTTRTITDFSGVTQARFRLVVSKGGQTAFVTAPELNDGLSNFTWYFDSATGTAYLRFAQSANSYVYNIKTESSVSGTPTAAVDGGVAPAFATLTPHYTLASGLNNDFSISTSGSQRVTVNGSGNVGVGTTTPSVLMDVNGTFRAKSYSAFGSVADINQSSLLFPGQSYTSVVNIEDRITDASSTWANGISAYVQYDPSANAVTDAYAGDYEIFTKASNTRNIRGINGFYSQASHYGTGAVSNAVGVHAFASNEGSGTIVAVTGINASGWNAGTGTVQKAYGVYVDNTSSGPVTTGYGVYIRESAGTNSYGLYQFDPTEQNFFAGSVGIGVSAPTAALEVRSKVLVSNATNGSNTNMAALNSTASDGAYLHLRRDAANEWYFQADPTANNALHLRHGNLASTPDVTFTQAGFMGLGTSAPATKLNIGGLGAGNATALRIDSQDTYYRDIFMSEFNTTSYGGILRYHSGLDLLQLITMEAGVEKYGVAVARATGFVGIGMNSAAAYRLDVNGDIHITGTPYRDGGDIAWTVPSDARLKDVKRNYNRGLKEILNIGTVIYSYKKGNIKNIDPEKEFTGVLAQNVQENIPEAVKEDKDGFLSLNTTPIFWAMINAIKDLYHEITGVQREIASLKEDNKAKDQEIKELKERLDRIEKSLQAKPKK